MATGLQSVSFLTIDLTEILLQRPRTQTRYLTANLYICLLYTSVSSMGALTYFNERHAPAGSAAYCSQCSVKGCVYRAQDLYLKYRWMSGYFHVGEQTDEAILSSLAHSPYDRCVYRCDNDVVDHQVTILGFEGGVTVAHSMTAFSKEIYRDIKIHGTKAELYGIMEKDVYKRQDITKSNAHSKYKEA